jgi:hypothetical protein
VKTLAGAFGERCGNMPTVKTLAGFLCEGCLQYTKDSYNESLLKMLRDARKVKP